MHHKFHFGRLGVGCKLFLSSAHDLTASAAIIIRADCASRKRGTPIDGNVIEFRVTDSGSGIRSRLSGEIMLTIRFITADGRLSASTMPDPRISTLPLIVEGQWATR